MQHAVVRIHGHQRVDVADEQGITASWQPFSESRSGGSFQPAAAYQVDGEAAQPVAAFVVLALDAVEAGLLQFGLPAR